MFSWNGVDVNWGMSGWMLIASDDIFIAAVVPEAVVRSQAEGAIKGL